MNKKIELLQAQIDHRGNFYPSGIYNENELPNKIKNDENNPHVVKYTKNKNNSDFEKKEIYNGNKTKELKPKTEKLESKNKPQPELKEENKTPKENKSTKTSRVKKEEVL